MPKKRRTGPAPSIAAASISERGMACKPGVEEQKVIADLLPHRRQHHQEHRLRAVERVIPDNAVFRERIGDEADARIEQERPQHGGDRGRDRVRPDQQRLISLRAARHAIGA